MPRSTLLWPKRGWCLQQLRNQGEKRVIPDFLMDSAVIHFPCFSFPHRGEKFSFFTTAEQTHKQKTPPPPCKIQVTSYSWSVCIFLSSTPSPTYYSPDSSGGLFSSKELMWAMNAPPAFLRVINWQGSPPEVGCLWAQGSYNVHF